MQHCCHMTLSCSFRLFCIFKHRNLWQLDQIIRWNRSRLCFIHWNGSLSYIHCIVGFPVQCAPFYAAHFGKCSTFTFMHLADTKQVSVFRVKTDCHWGSTHKWTYLYLVYTPKRFSNSLLKAFMNNALSIYNEHCKVLYIFINYCNQLKCVRFSCHVL